MLYGRKVRTKSNAQVLPGTALEKRLLAEGRMSDRSGDISYTTLTNFTPSRLVDEIAREFMDGFWMLYDPAAYIDRVYRCYKILGKVKFPPKNREHHKIKAQDIKAMFILLWHLGIRSPCRKKFWTRLFGVLKENPDGLVSFLSVLAQLEHFTAYRQTVRDQIQAQLSGMTS